MSIVNIKGQCDPRFEAVQQAFGKLFEDQTEVGASFSLYYQGALVVNLWAGETANEAQPEWQQNSLVNVFSVSKAVTALCVQRAIDAGAMDVARPVADYWPEYGCNGKKRTTVSQLLNHQAGQPALKTQLADDAIYDWEQMTSVLASEEPWWQPGTDHGYHMITYGWLVGESFRRAVGLSVNQFLQDEIVKPNNLEMYFGVPDSELSRIVNLSAAKGLPEPGRISLFNHVMTEPASVTARALMNPLSIMNGANTLPWRKAEIPSANLHSTSASLATLFGRVACREGILSDAALQRCQTEETAGPDRVLLTHSRFGPGFMLQQQGDQEAEFGPGLHAFGHPGAGGALSFSDPEQELGFSYVMNQLGPYVLIDPRPRSLIAAVYDCLKR